MVAVHVCLSMLAGHMAAPINHTRCKEGKNCLAIDIFVTDVRILFTISLVQHPRLYQYRVSNILYEVFYRSWRQSWTLPAESYQALYPPPGTIKSRHVSAGSSRYIFSGPSSPDFPMAKFPLAIGIAGIKLPPGGPTSALSDEPSGHAPEHRNVWPKVGRVTADLRAASSTSPAATPHQLVSPPSQDLTRDRCRSALLAL